MYEVLQKFVNDISVTEYITYLAILFSSFISLILYTEKQIKDEKNEIIDKHLINSDTIDAHIKNLKEE